jgi:hypothetical protein
MYFITMTVNMGTRVLTNATLWIIKVKTAWQLFASLSISNKINVAAELSNQAG